MTLKSVQNLDGQLNNLPTFKTTFISELKLKNIKLKGVSMLTKTFVLLICLSTSSFALASKIDGAGSGGGGDVRCFEYSNLVGEVVKSLAIAGQDKVDQLNPLIRVNDLITIKSKLKCLPVEELDRQARSYPEDLHTDLLVSNWDKLGQMEKINLASHELSILAKYENDGEYFVSEDIIKIVSENSKYLKNQLAAERVINNTDGSVTFFNPFALIDGKKIKFGVETRVTHGYELVIPRPSSIDKVDRQLTAKSVCRYLGFNDSLGFNLIESNDSVYSMVDKMGHLSGTITKEGGSAGTVIFVSWYEYSILNNFQTLTCK